MDGHRRLRHQRDGVVRRLPSVGRRSERPVGAEYRLTPVVTRFLMEGSEAKHAHDEPLVLNILDGGAVWQGWGVLAAVEDDQGAAG